MFGAGVGGLSSVMTRPTNLMLLVIGHLDIDSAPAMRAVPAHVFVGRRGLCAGGRGRAGMPLFEYVVQAG